MKIHSLAKVDDYLEKLWQEGNRCFNDLSSDEAKCLAGYIMVELPKTDREEFITQTDNMHDSVCDLARFLISFECNEFPEEGGFFENHKSRGRDLLESISYGAKEFSKNYINKLFIDKKDKEMRASIWDEGNKHADNEIENYKNLRVLK